MTRATTYAGDLSAADIALAITAAIDWCRVILDTAAALRVTYHDIYPAPRVVHPADPGDRLH